MITARIKENQLTPIPKHITVKKCPPAAVAPSINSYTAFAYENKSPVNGVPGCCRAFDPAAL